MGKQETIEHLRALYLKGKSERMKERFLAKDLDRQYASLKNWESRMRKKSSDDNSPNNIALAIEKLRSEIRAVKTLSPEEIETFHNAINSLHTEIDDAHNRIKNAMISELERKQEEIRQQLASLKGEY